MRQNQAKYGDIIIDISNEKVDRTFQYRIPDALVNQIHIGDRVEIPFGNGNTMRRGYVVDIKEKPEYDIGKIKDIAGVAADEVSVQSQLIKLAWWMKEQYGSTMNQALKTVLPVKQKVKERDKKTLVCLLSPADLKSAIEEAQKKNFKARERILKAFLMSASIPMEVARDQLHLSQATIKPLSDKKILEIRTSSASESRIQNWDMQSSQVILNDEQQYIVEDFRSEYEKGKRGTYLIHGITGSGKTEVYMELIFSILQKGGQVIVLIPEIALTYQTVMRFYKRFGDQVAIINSRLSKGERYTQWERAKNGEVSIMIGPRSALFTPFKNLGLIIIDEEHEGAYKSEGMPRYHARDVAIKRAAMNYASVVLGSATPSLEAYAGALGGEYKLYTLNSRATADSRLAAVSVVDLRKELSDGNKSMFSRLLYELTADRLSKGEQIMLFINRRGYANFVSCRSCGQAIRCPHCDVSLTLHNNGLLTCHYCGYSLRVPDRCPSCGSPYIAHFGVGTQKLELMAKKLFPDARILRMDADTTAKKGGHEEILAAFAEGSADILIGTQMIVKGHDFPKVTLVGVMAADLSLYAPDFRCAERTFQLLTQAAGRAGRGSSGGNVVIQTYNPEHYSIKAAADQDYKSFYSQEMTYRKVMNYPPVCKLLTVQAASRFEEKLEESMSIIREEIETDVKDEGLQVIGPVNAPVYKVNDIYRKILYIKNENYDILIQIKNRIETVMDRSRQKGYVLMQYDFS